MATVFVNGPRIARSSEKITTLTSSTGLTLAKYDLYITTNPPYDQVRHAVAAAIQVLAAAIKWTTDGTAPTATAGTGIGFISNPGDIIVIEGYENIGKFRAINEVASSGSGLYVEYYF